MVEDNKREMIDQMSVINALGICNNSWNSFLVSAGWRSIVLRICLFQPDVFLYFILFYFIFSLSFNA